MTRTLLPEVHDPETRLALAEAVLGVLDGWGVAPAKQAELLGLADIAPLIPGAPLPDDPDVLERAGHLLGIERALKRRHPDDPAARHAWLMFPAAELGGQPPLRVMLDGVKGIERVRTLLDTGARAPRGT
jgi:hypothetical protein